MGSEDPLVYNIYKTRFSKKETELFSILILMMVQGERLGLEQILSYTNTFVENIYLLVNLNGNKWMNGTPVDHPLQQLWFGGR